MRLLVMSLLLGLSLSSAAAIAAPPVPAAPATPSASQPAAPVETYEDWRVTMEYGMIGAYTENGSGSTFGLACSKSCVAYVSTKNSCENGSTHPGLLNSSGGAVSIVVRCAIIDKHYVNVIENDAVLLPAFKAGGQLGIAFPLANGLFNVSRFSLRGSITAITRGRQVAQGLGLMAPDLKDTVQ